MLFSGLFTPQSLKIWLALLIGAHTINASILKEAPDYDVLESLIVFAVFEVFGQTLS